MPHRASTFLNPLGAYRPANPEPPELCSGSATFRSRIRRALNLRRTRDPYVRGRHSGNHARRPGQTSNIDLNSIESVDVLRGPFSALYGNASGGVININTQTGQQPATIEASSYYGSYGTGVTV